MNEGYFTSWEYKPMDGLVQGYFSIGPNNMFASERKLNHKIRLPMTVEKTKTHTTADTTCVKWPKQIWNIAGINLEPTICTSHSGPNSPPSRKKVILFIISKLNIMFVNKLTRAHSA